VPGGDSEQAALVSHFMETVFDPEETCFYYHGSEGDGQQPWIGLLSPWNLVNHYRPGEGNHSTDPALLYDDEGGRRPPHEVPQLLRFDILSRKFT
jgi:hypothetical protein